MRGMEKRRASALCEIALASLWLATAPLFEQIWCLEYRQPSPLRELEQIRLVTERLSQAPGRACAKKQRREFASLNQE